MPRTLLVIEDDPLLIELMCDVAAMAGHRAETLDIGAGGLAGLCELRPDLIFLDLTLGAIDGLAVARQLRACPAGRGVPIVLVSGREPTAEEAALADGYLQKPFRLAELVETMARHLAMDTEPTTLPQPERGVA